MFGHIVGVSGVTLTPTSVLATPPTSVSTDCSSGELLQFRLSVHRGTSGAPTLAWDSALRWQRVALGGLWGRYSGCMVWLHLAMKMQQGYSQESNQCN